MVLKIEVSYGTAESRAPANWQRVIVSCNGKSLHDVLVPLEQVPEAATTGVFRAVQIQMQYEANEAQNA